MGFTATENKGFRMNLKWTYNFSTMGNSTVKKRIIKIEMKEPIWESAEIAVFNDKGIVPIGDTDESYITADEVAKVIEIVSGYQGQKQI